ncbi:HEPN domain-containing protein [Pseudanabaena sp. 'Roaring Creek']|uniref:HEPN domain-containing protein n=1 Tax=Pseudanabaena sp. 'Roaring Creek' TaxID=1681830 RepID=UPI0006D7DC32|nr:HEPN domain-containing protein [Pseudanabaena sp. 'Roaring Creek']
MTTEQQQLLTKAANSIKAAQILTDEGLHDSGVSRAYYAMFYIAEAFLIEDGLSFSKHSAVISKFGEHFAKTNRVPSEFHRYLIESEQSRLRGDYDASYTTTETEAIEQIERANLFLTFANQYFN